MAQATSNQPALPTCREISALTMKMPEPTMMPATTMTESKRPSARWNSVGGLVPCVSCASGVVGCIRAVP